MKRHEVRSLFFSWAVACMACLFCAVFQVRSGSLEEAYKEFQHPSRNYSTGPLWVWNDMLTPDQIRDSLRELSSQQIKQVWVHPRPGLMTPYLGKEWFNLWRITLDEAKKLDMNVWIYDENSYPSGFAGGFVPEVMPESRGRGLFFASSNAPIAWATNFLAVFRLDGSGSQDVSSSIAAGEHLPPGNYLAGFIRNASNSPWHGNRSYVDLLYPGVTAKFLDITLEPYRRHFGKEFGKRIPGVFTDEPQLQPAGGLPWTPDLPQQFNADWGYDLIPTLASLKQPVGDWKRVRYNYFSTLNRLFIERWAKPYGDYCQTNGLEMTGHYWEHDWPRCTSVPDNMAMYAWMQRPAIDCLMNQYQESTHAQFGNVRAVKELSSVANQLGKGRTLCEAYGAGGWDLRFEDMKRIGDWLSVLGVNTLNQHLSYITLRGARKRDHPQSFSYHEPWWEAYHVSASYFARLSVALSQGKQLNSILVLEPTTTAWMYQGDESLLAKLGDTFFSTLMDLERAQVEYDLGDEDILARHARVSDSALTVGQRSYPIVVIPPGMENLRARTLELLGEFLARGGTLLRCDDYPAYLDGVRSETLQAPLGRGKSEALGLSRLIPTLKRLAQPEVVEIRRDGGDKGILFHHRRSLGNGEVLFLANTSKESVSKGTIATSAHSVEIWDLSSGKRSPFPSVRHGSGLEATFLLPPSGSLLLAFRCDGPVLETKEQPSVETSVISPVGELKVKRIGPNVLPMDFVDITAGGIAKSNVYVYDANRLAFKANGLERNPWDSAVQFGNEFISRSFPPDSGFTASYHFIVAQVPLGEIDVVLERPDLYWVELNGTKIKSEKGKWWLDKSFGMLPVSRLVKVGENVLTIKARPFTMFHEVETAYLVGDFGIQPTQRGFEIKAPIPATLGAWKDQGMPFYSSGMSYSQVHELGNPKSTRSLVSLTDWYGSVARVRVNGRQAGYIVSQPWELDVSDLVKKGQNQIEVTVIGTLKNTLGPHHGKPALGTAWPGMFQKAPPSGGIPPGDEYSTVAYGLFKPFSLRVLQKSAAPPKLAQQ